MTYALGVLNKNTSKIKTVLKTALNELQPALKSKAYQLEGPVSGGHDNMK